MPMDTLLKVINQFRVNFWARRSEAKRYKYCTVNKDEHLRCSQSFPFLNFASTESPHIHAHSISSEYLDSWRNITKISSGTGVGRFLHGTFSNMVAVHPLQVKEPSATVSQMSSLGSSSVGDDSILVEPTTSGASNKSTNTFWYFAIGSMMSPKRES